MKSIADEGERINSHRATEEQWLRKQYHPLWSLQTADKAEEAEGGSERGSRSMVAGGGSSLASLYTDRFPTAEPFGFQFPLQAFSYHEVSAGNLCWKSFVSWLSSGAQHSQHPWLAVFLLLGADLRSQLAQGRCFREHLT
jgi:hypothetical protein